MTARLHTLALWVAVIFAAVVPTRAFAFREIPPLVGPLMDETGSLSGADRRDLEGMLRAYAPHAQLQVWILRSLEGEAIETLSIRAVEAWKLGTARDDKGLLLLVALNDRAVRIEVGQGLEGDIPDVVAGRVIRDIFVPAMRQGDLAGAVRETSRVLLQRAAPDANVTWTSERPVGRRSGRMPLPLWAWIIVFIFVGLRFFVGGSRFGSGRIGSGWGHGRGGWGGGGWGGGGGGWSGGGGGFSGGGSSGRW